MSNNKDKVLILGGLGLVGSSVAQELAKSFDVVIVDIRKPKGNLNRNISYRRIDALNNNDLDNLICSIKPKIVINTINIATIYSHDPDKNFMKMIKFYYQLYQILNRIKGKIFYLQMGTTGAGGLGFNIPFTHGEKIEDMPIINKAAFAGISTAMLALLSKSFNNGVKIAEIKPGLAIFKEQVECTAINDCNLVVIDGGESGYYTYNELALLTSFMGFTTAKAIVNKILSLINEKKSIHRHCFYDIIESINSATVTQSSADRRKLHKILKQMKKLSGNEYIIATGNLGPPNITRGLILSCVKILHPDADDAECTKILENNKNVKNTLNYIKKTKPTLYQYLKRELNFTNFAKIPNMYSEPWQNVKLILENNKKPGT